MRVASCRLALGFSRSFGSHEWVGESAAPFVPNVESFGGVLCGFHAEDKRFVFLVDGHLSCGGDGVGIFFGGCDFVCEGTPEVVTKHLDDAHVVRGLGFGGGLLPQEQVHGVGVGGLCEQHTLFEVEFFHLFGGDKPEIFVSDAT